VSVTEYLMGQLAPVSPNSMQHPYHPIVSLCQGAFKMFFCKVRLGKKKTVLLCLQCFRNMISLCVIDDVCQCVYLTVFSFCLCTCVLHMIPNICLGNIVVMRCLLSRMSHFSHLQTVMECVRTV